MPSINIISIIIAIAIGIFTLSGKLYSIRKMLDDKLNGTDCIRCRNDMEALIQHAKDQFREEVQDRARETTVARHTESIDALKLAVVEIQTQAKAICSTVEELKQMVQMLIQQKLGNHAD
jgi:hypothetical protein